MSRVRAAVAGSDRSTNTRPSNTAGDGTPRRKLAAHIREQLLAGIWSGRWRPGDHLPTEVELMAHFGVSRAPVREAMQSLHLLGIVDISPRRGAVVRALPAEEVVDLAVLSGVMDQERPVADLFEFRDAIESRISELCAANATTEQIESIRSILEENGRIVRRGRSDEAQEIDVRFHAAIADASSNLVFIAVAKAVSGLLVELRRTIGGIPGASAASYLEHQEIFAAIRQRKAPAARRATERHIRNARARYEAARGDCSPGAEATAEADVTSGSTPTTT